jgi:hypothetical protein
VPDLRRFAASQARTCTHAGVFVDEAACEDQGSLGKSTRLPLCRPKLDAALDQFGS